MTLAQRLSIFAIVINAAVLVLLAYSLWYNVRRNREITRHLKAHDEILAKLLSEAPRDRAGDLRPLAYRTRQDAFGRWIITHPDADDLAWSGQRWVSIHTNGVPTGVQVCNFANEAEALKYAAERKL